MKGFDGARCLFSAIMPICSGAQHVLVALRTSIESSTRVGSAESRGTTDVTQVRSEHSPPLVSQKTVAPGLVAGRLQMTSKVGCGEGCYVKLLACFRYRGEGVQLLCKRPTWRMPSLDGRPKPVDLLHIFLPFHGFPTRFHHRGRQAHTLGRSACEGSIAYFTILIHIQYTSLFQCFPTPLLTVTSSEEFRMSRLLWSHWPSRWLPLVVVFSRCIRGRSRRRKNISTAGHGHQRGKVCGRRDSPSLLN